MIPPIDKDEPMPHEPVYIHLPLEAACAEKWKTGAAKHGDVFQGHPLVELDNELIDAINYALEAKSRGWNVPMKSIRTLEALRFSVQELFAVSPGEPLSGRDSVHKRCRGCGYRLLECRCDCTCRCGEEPEK